MKLFRLENEISEKASSFMWINDSKLPVRSSYSLIRSSIPYDSSQAYYS